MQHPITVAKRDGGYRLLAGAHRLTAFRELGIERISANIVELDDLHAELVELDGISPAMNCQQPSVRWQSPGSPVFGLRMQGFIDCLTSSRPFPISPGHFHGWGFWRPRQSFGKPPGPLCARA